MNRTIAPPTRPLDHISLPVAERVTLDNGIPLYMINAGDQEVVKLDFVFEAGKWYESRNLVADFVNRMMREGVRGKTSLQIADVFDFYGTNLESSVSFSNAGFQVYSLTRNLAQVLPLLMEIFTEATFPAHEFETMINNRRQKHTERLAKPEYIANRSFLSAMWGSRHPYGRVTEYADFDQADISSLQSFYKQYYNASNCFIIAAGRLDSNIIATLNNIFGSKAWIGSKAPIDISHTPEPAAELRIHTERKDAVQSAIMVGYATINKMHPDYDKLTILNTLYGGYFGSRLMANIREEKGYTYGIYSSLTSYHHGGIFEISAEVGREVSDATLAEIAAEIEIIRSEPADEEELLTVKNYMAGRILRSVDGPMKYSDVLKGLILYGLEPDYLTRYLQTIQQVTAEELQELAVRYLDFDRMYKVTVG